MSDRPAAGNVSSGAGWRMPKLVLSRYREIGQL
jgi:hypothetical protein